ncbi:MAG: PilZ domain-containing protein, partial [bacterium]
ETTGEEVVSTEENAEESRSADMTEEGRYIPYSGGVMGWFENSGVMKSEIGNNYQLHQLMQSDAIRATQFERWGERTNRRTVDKRYHKDKGVIMLLDKKEVKGTSRDISGHGVRIQFLVEANVNKGDECRIKLLETEDGPEIVELDARVVWSEKIGKIRPVWNVGMTFTDLTKEQTEKIQPLLVED